MKTSLVKARGARFPSSHRATALAIVCVVVCGTAPGCVAERIIAVEGTACGDEPCAGGAGSSGRATGGSPAAGGTFASDAAAGAAGSVLDASAGGVASGGAPAGDASTGEPDSSTQPPLYTLRVDAPEDGAAVSGSVEVRGVAPGFLNVEVWDATHQQPPLAQAEVASGGAFSMRVDTTTLTSGPTRWAVHAWNSPSGEDFTRTASQEIDLTIEPALGEGGACSGESCGGHGVCAVLAGNPRCECDDGYRATGLQCVPVDGSCETRPGAAGHVAPTCHKEALFGGAVLDLQRWADQLGRASLDIQTQWDNVNFADPSNDAEADWGWIAGHFSTNEHVVQADWPGGLSLGMPMWVRGQSPFVCASGANDVEMLRAISTLKDDVGDRVVYIRLGWVFNAEWYPTQTSDGDFAYRQAWKDCWIRWWDIIKSVDPDYRVVWNPLWANNGECQSGFPSVLDLWPGAEFVDAAGPNQFDANWCGRTVAYDEKDGAQPIGIGAWVDWVIAQGVPFAVPEWGVDSGSTGSGDRPQFIRDMYAAFKKAHESDSGLAFQSYFDGGANYACRYSLLDPACNQNPEASQVYFQLFSVWPPR